jgi:hypothetical protein
MKKYRLLLIFSSFLVCKFSLAQKSNQLELGVEFGPTLSSLRGNTILERYHTSKLSYAAGLFLLYHFKQGISLVTGPAYENKGSKIKESQYYDDLGNPIGIGEGRTEYHYLTFPILVRKWFGNKDLFFVNTGPYLGYLIKQTSKIKINNGPTSTIDNTENDKQIDFGIAIGAGLKFPLNNRCNFLLEIRNNLGLINTSDIPVADNGSIKTNTLNLLVGFSFFPGHRSGK